MCCKAAFSAPELTKTNNDNAAMQNTDTVLILRGGNVQVNLCLLLCGHNNLNNAQTQKEDGLTGMERLDEQMQ